MKVITRGENIDYESYRFLKKSGISAIVLLKFDLTMGPYIAFKGVYEKNVKSIRALDDPEYLAQFYVGISGTELDVLEKNEERIVIARQTTDIDAIQANNVLLLSIEPNISTSAASQFAKDLLKNSNAEPHLLEELITQLKESEPDLELKLKSSSERAPHELQRLKSPSKPHKLAKLKWFTSTPFRAFQNWEFNEIELSFPKLKKSMFFIKVPFEGHDMARFFDLLFSHMVIEKDTNFSIDMNKDHSGFYMCLTLVLPPNQRNFVERLAAAFNMAGFSISIVRETELETYWISPLGIFSGTSLRISRKHKNYIEVLDSPSRFISLFRSKTMSSLNITTLTQFLDSMYFTILCKGIGKNKVAVEIVLTKLHSNKVEMEQFNLPAELAEHFKKVRGRRRIISTVKNLLRRYCSKGTKLSLQELNKFF